ncbi:MAG: hypothetical protein EBU53_04620 [Proteobacteria bacterium]|nr:hypothetical protein [Pseudomonadota bacterium]
MTNLTKIEVQKRVLLDGKPLDLYKFNWDGETKTFSSRECYLVFDFANINNCTFDTGALLKLVVDALLKLVVIALLKLVVIALLKLVVIALSTLVVIA